MDVTAKTWSHEGMKGFYKGIVPSLIRGVPSKGFYFFIYEYLKDRAVK